MQSLPAFPLSRILYWMISRLLHLTHWCLCSACFLDDTYTKLQGIYSLVIWFKNHENVYRQYIGSLYGNIGVRHQDQDSYFNASYDGSTEPDKKFYRCKEHSLLNRGKDKDYLNPFDKAYLTCACRACLHCNVVSGRAFRPRRSLEIDTIPSWAFRRLVSKLQTQSTSTNSYLAGRS